MTRPFAIALAALTAALAAGCAIRPVEADSETPRFATIWELPRLEQQPVLLDVKLEGSGDPDRLRDLAAEILLASGKFRVATPQDEPGYKIDVTLRVTRSTDLIPAVYGAFILYAIPVHVQDIVCEVFADIRSTSPPHEKIAHCYAQARGGATLWIGHLFSGAWLGNRKAMDAIRRDALKSAIVRMCRKLVPKEKPKEEPK